MLKSAQLVQFPEPSSMALWILALGFFCMIFGAVLMEVFRRRGLQRRLLQVEWKDVSQIIKERSLSENETELLKSLIRRFAPTSPLKAVTTRRVFSKCVASMMEKLRNAGDVSAFERTGIELREIRTALGLEYVPIGQRIRSTRELHPGQWVGISMARDSSPIWVRGMVDLVDESYLYLSWPKDRVPDTPQLRAGDEVRCRLWRDEDARYVFQVTVVGYEAPPPVLRLHHTEELSRTQTRSHFRVRHDQTTKVGVLDAPIDGNMDHLKARRAVTTMRGRITSLSAGGCALVLSQAVTKQVCLRIELTLPGDTLLTLELRIVSITPISGGRYLVRGAFAGLDDERRDHVAKHVMQRQQSVLLAKEMVE